MEFERVSESRPTLPKLAKGVNDLHVCIEPMRTDVATMKGHMTWWNRAVLGAIIAGALASLWQHLDTKSVISNDDSRAQAAVSYVGALTAQERAERRKTQDEMKREIDLLVKRSS